ncbi:MAG: glycosyltransferase [Acidimicrobiales bacterium]
MRVAAGRLRGAGRRRPQRRGAGAGRPGAGSDHPGPPRRRRPLRARARHGGAAQGPPGLVAAFELVAGADPDVRLVLAGPDGWGAEALTAALRRARHRDRVRRIGWVDATERAALLRGATAFAYPSVYEGFGLPPLEAMSAGVPVVTTAAGAIPETVGDAALVVPVGDREALARALTQVLEDDTVRRDLVVRGGARVASHPWATTIDGLVALYRRAADG